MQNNDTKRSDIAETGFFTPCCRCGKLLYIKEVIRFHCSDCEKAEKDKPFVRMQLLQDIEDSKRVDNE